MFWLILKLLTVLIFLIVFLRRPNLIWGIGLLAVTTAVLLDTFLGTFGREEMLTELGFFFYIIAGALLGGMTVWAFGWLRPYTAPNSLTSSAALATHNKKRPAKANTAFDRQMLFNEIRQRFSPEDVRDLIFDLGINENDVITFNQSIPDLIIALIDRAEDEGKAGAMALAVERILTPMPPENLPRPEKIDADSPPTILRHYLLAHYNLAELEAIATSLEIDWEQLDSNSKKSKVRSLLLHLYRRNRLFDLIDLIKPPPPAPEPEQPAEAS